ncbi:MAG: two-component regulator propeller domain-containing protein [Flavobacteriaceae bacterium]
MLKRCFLPFVLFCLLASHLTAQKGSSFSRTIQLPKKVEVLKIIQDSKGFLWLGTSNGLYRFDGLNFKSYFNKHGDATTIVDDEIYSLLEDSKGSIWIGTRSGGISVLNPLSGQFSHFKYDPKVPPHKVNFFITAIYEDRDGTIWVGSQGSGLGKYNPQTKAFDYYRSKKEDENSLAQDYVIDILQDKDGFLWIGLNGGGIDKFDITTERFEHFPFNLLSNSTANFRNNVIRELVDDGKGNLWAATYGGLNKLNKQTGSYTHFDQANSKLETNSLNSLHTWGNMLFFTSYDGYTYQFDPVKEEVLHTNRSDKNIRYGFRDPEGNLILGYTSGEISMTFPSTDFSFSEIPEKESYIKTIHPNKTGLLIGTLESGLYHSQHGNISKYDIPKELQISDISVDQDNTFWLGTYSKGLWHYNPQTRQSKAYRFDPNDPTSLSHDTVLDLYRDQQGTLWVGTMSGLNQWVDSTGSFIRRGSAQFRDIIKTSENVLLAATDLGLANIDLKTNSFHMKQADPLQGKDSLLHNQLNALFTPDGDSILIGGKKGLNLYRRSQKKMINLHDHLNLPYQEIKSIVQDHHKNYWFLGKETLIQADLKTGDFKFYDESDGVNLANPIGKEICFLPENKMLVLGTQGGFYKFLPKELGKSSEEISIHLDEIRLFNKSLEDTEKLSAIANSEPLELAYDQNMVSFSFIGFNYRNPSKVKYAYLLDGLDDRWLYTTDRSATFTNLEPGSYTFKVKATSLDGLWEVAPKTLTFEILPPFWASRGAFVLYGLLLLFFLYLIIQNLKSRARMKQQLIKDQLELEKVQEINAMKSRFLSNISHEFRTPLTLITNPLEELSEKSKDKEANETLRLVQRNVKQLKKMINQLLDYAQLEENKMPVRLKKQEVFQLVRVLGNSFTSLAKTKNIDFDISIPNASFYAKADDEKLAIIINNLLSNAFKFTPKNGRVALHIWIKNTETESFLNILVKDSGIGFDEKEKNEIFERFYRLEAQDSDGTGIGLALTKEVVALLKGKIIVRSERNKGSEFLVTIPVKAIEKFEGTALNGSLKKEVASVAENKILQAPEKPSSNLVLIVEDNPDLRDYLVKLLQPHWQVITAINGTQAIALAREKVPDLVISDLMMPEMDGIALCQQLKADLSTAHIPIIILTAKASQTDRLEGLAVGAIDYLIKPFDKKELHLKVANILVQRNSLQKRVRDELLAGKLSENLESQEERFILKLNKAIFAHLNDHKLNVDFLSDKMGLSRVQLYRKVMAITGLSTSDLIRRIRMQKASDLLRANWGSISEIAYEVGFNNLPYFTRTFKKFYNKTPSDYIKSSSTT